MNVLSKKIKLGLGFIILLCLFSSVVIGIGFHQADEISSGIFSGRFEFVDGLTIKQNCHSGYLSDALNIDYCLAVNDAVRLQAGNSTKYNNLVLNPYGANVGIATTNPTARLEIGPTGVSSGEYSSIKAFNAGNSFIWGHTNSAYDNSIGALNGGGQPFISFFSYHSDTANQLKRSSSLVPPGMFLYNTDGKLHFYNAPAGTQDVDINNFISRFVIQNDGNVGIGTDYPNAKLDVAGTIRVEQICDENGINCHDISAGWAAASSDRKYAMLNINDKGVNVYLYSPYTAFHVGSMSSVRANQGKSSGKWYWEVNINSNYHLIPGIGTNDATLVNDNQGSIYSTNGWGYYTYTNPDQMWHVSNQGNSNLNAVSGSTIMFALDLDNKRLWYGVDGTWVNSGNPSTGSNPSVSGLPSSDLYPVSSGERSTVAYFNFGQQDFKYSVPSGFNPGWYE